MSDRRGIGLVMLCEDRQHEAFLRRFLKSEGWRQRMRVERCPGGRGAGEQWVRERFPMELRELRRGHVSMALIAMIDADRATVSERIEAVDAACQKAGVAPPRTDEPVALFVPRRNIETWIAYLAGEDVNEDDAYPKLRRERDCAPSVKALKKMCDDGELRAPAPPSMEAACDEYSSRLAGGCA